MATNDNRSPENDAIPIFQMTSLTSEELLQRAIPARVQPAIQQLDEHIYPESFAEDEQSQLKFWDVQALNNEDLDFLALDSKAEKDLDAEMTSKFERDINVCHLTNSNETTDSIIKNLRQHYKTLALEDQRQKKKGAEDDDAGVGDKENMKINPVSTVPRV